MHVNKNRLYFTVIMTLVSQTLCTISYEKVKNIFQVSRSFCDFATNIKPELIDVDFDLSVHNPVVAQLEYSFHNITPMGMHTSLISSKWTTIGQFIWDLQKTQFFGNHTDQIADYILKALSIQHRVYCSVPANELLTVKEFVMQHRNQYSCEEINRVRSEIAELILMIQNESLENLQDASYLEHHLLLKLGLNNENLHEFPAHLAQFYGNGLKSWQYPNQFSKFLVSLSKLSVENYLEIGCRHGGTFIIIHEYLKRFNAQVRSVAVDPFYSLIMDIYVNDIDSNASYVVDFSTSKRFIDLSAHQWDISFIDGDHSYRGALLDYLLVKDCSKNLVFHDIVNDACPGVQQIWRELKSVYGAVRTEEYIEQYQEVVERMHRNYLGIGVIHVR